MVKRCDKCNRLYDDAQQWTLCPHAPLDVAPEDYCPSCDTIPSMYEGKCVCGKVVLSR